MANTPRVYAICDANCRWETLTREEILAAITQAVNEGTISNIDTGFVQTIKTINGKGLKFFVGEQSEYDTLTEEDKKDLFAIITNDTTKEGLLNAISTLQTKLTDIETKLENGSFVVGETKTIAIPINSGSVDVIGFFEAGKIYICSVTMYTGYHLASNDYVTNTYILSIPKDLKWGNEQTTTVYSARSEKFSYYQNSFDFSFLRAVFNYDYTAKLSLMVHNANEDAREFIPTSSTTQVTIVCREI